MLDEETRRKIFEAAEGLRLGVDGDLIYYYGKSYFVSVLNNMIIEIDAIPLWVMRLPEAQRDIIRASYDGKCRLLEES